LKEQAGLAKIQEIIDALIKKWYWVSIPFIVFIFLGAWLYVVLPREYEANTLIFVQPQEIPSNYVQTTVSVGVEERVSTLSQEVMSRSNLEGIIKEFDLFKESRVRGVPMDILITSMRKRIEINIGAARGRRRQVSSFSISYRGGHPRIVADVTNRLASFFIESNLKLRAKQAAQATLFLEKQLEDLTVLLEEQEGKVEEYRNKHMGELPEQLQSNLSTIVGYQTRLESLNASMSDTLDRRLMIKQQLSQIDADQPGLLLSSRAQRINQLKAQLEDVRSRYTSQHPEIKRIEKQIDELEKVPEEPVAATDPQLIELQSQLANVDVEIKRSKQDIERLQERIAFYQERVENTPKREQEIAGLTRDYNITQQNYQRLLDRYYEAKRAESMEKRQQGEQFRVIDFAQVPQTPISPDFKKIILVFLFLGLGSGTGIIFLLETVDSTVKSVGQLEKWAGNIPCITAVPLALTQADKKKRRLKTVLIVLFNILIGGIGIGVVLYAYINNISIKLPVSLPF